MLTFHSGFPFFFFLLAAAQLVEVYVSKLLALSYAIASVDVHGVFHSLPSSRLLHTPMPLQRSQRTHQARHL